MNSRPESFVSRGHPCTKRRGLVVLAVIVGLPYIAMSACAADRSADERALSDSPATVLARSDVVALPSAIAVLRDRLVLGDRADTLLNLLHSQSGRLLAKTGRRGEGPSEFKLITTLQEFPLGSGRVWAFDGALLRIDAYAVARADSFQYLTNSIRLQVPGRPIAVQWVDDTTLVAAGFFQEGRLYLVRRDGTAIRPIGEIPLTSDKVPPLAAQQALQPSLAVRPFGNLAAVGSRYAARLDIYDLRTGTMKPAQVPLAFQPEMDIIRRGDLPIFVSNQQTRFGYIDVAATSDRIYALFSGRTRAGFPGRANMGTDVHVFDWNGAFLGAVKLDWDVLRIAVDASNSTLFAISEEPDPAVLAYSLSKR